MRDVLALYQLTRLVMTGTLNHNFKEDWKDFTYTTLTSMSIQYEAAVSRKLAWLDWKQGKQLACLCSLIFKESTYQHL